MVALPPPQPAGIKPGGQGREAARMERLQVRLGPERLPTLLDPN